MLIAAFILLAAAVVLGTALAIWHLRAQTVAAAPWTIAALHGLLGITGLGWLIVALRGLWSGPPQPNALFAVMGAVLIALAALVGGGIFATRLRKGRHVGTLIGIHVTIAVSGFVVLAAYLFAG